MQLFAQATPHYISVVCIGYGDSGKKMLKDNGYTVWEKLNANEGGNGDAVYIGYKTTTDKADAITDLSTMNMNGAYSFGAWEEELAKAQEDVDSFLDKADATIDEFKENYKANNPYAIKAAEVLNSFYDDYSGKKIGEIVISDNETDFEALNNVFLKGNIDILSVIDRFLAIGCVEYGKNDTFVSRLAAYEFTGELDMGANAERTIVYEMLKVLADDVKTYETQIAIYENAGADIDDEDSLSVLTETQQSEYLVAKGTIQCLAETAYTSNLDMTLLDLAHLSEEEYEDSLFEPMAKCMTAGQLGVVEMVGLDFLISLAYRAEDEELISYLDEALGELEWYGKETASVYAGVDTSIYDDPESVAMTLAANSEDSAGSSFGVKADDNAQEIATYVVAGLAAAATIATVVVSVYMRKATTYHFKLAGKGDTLHAEKVWYEPKFTPKVCTIVTVVAVVISLVLYILSVCLFVTSEKTEEIEYTEIPRVLIDVSKERVDGRKRYITYYAAKRIDADETSENSMDIYGDLNGYNKVNEWVALYYSKDTNIGEPLTADMLVYSDLKTVPSGYSAIHDFDTTSAANLNFYNSGKNRKVIYAYVKYADSESTVTASTFSNTGAVLLAVGCFVAGAALSAGVMYAAEKKKKVTA